MNNARSIKLGLIRLALIGSVLLGLFGAASVSYVTVAGGAPCPNVLGIPVCFIVLAGYMTLFVASVLGPGRFVLPVFMAGWISVFLPAVAGTALELISGSVCPKSSAGIPLCFLSLLLSVTILGLFIFVHKKTGSV